MGQQLSTSNIPPEDLPFLLEISNFSEKDLDKLYLRFQHLDKQKTGYLTSKELQLPEFAVNPLADRITSVIFEQGNLDFKKFVETIQVFSKNAKRETKLEFAFKVYDVDCDGYISYTDLFQVIRSMVGNSLSDLQVGKIVEDTINENDQDNDGMLKLEEFKRALFDADIDNILTIKL
ncbi:Calcineurin subunit B type 2 [Boothiomyces sp. JEL0866]|nr:Calcineurin subunit B type 2 [Boothiomyces sp. JEL0866]